MRAVIGKCCVIAFLGFGVMPTGTTSGASDAGTSQWSLSSVIDQLSINGEWNEEQARVMIQAVLKGLDRGATKTMVATSARQAIHVARDQVRQQIALRLDALQGALEETALTLGGEGEIVQVTGDGLRAWSLRQSADGGRSLVLRFEESKEPRRAFTGTVIVETPVERLPARVAPLTLTPEQPALFHGYVRIDVDPALAAEAVLANGLVGIDRKYLPGDFAPVATAAVEPLAYRFQGGGIELALDVTVGDPEARRVVLNQFELRGALGPGRAEFSLSAIARVRNPRGGRLELLSGAVALTSVGAQNGWRLGLDDGRYVFECDGAGDYPIALEFNAAVREQGGWRHTDFKVAPSAVQPLVLTGLGTDTQFEFPGAARPEWTGDGFASHLPADGAVRLAWKEARPETEGRLFYAVEGLSQISVGTGLLRQMAWLEFKVMQGELSRVALDLVGEGEVTRVMGPQVLAWTVEAGADEGDRQLVVQLNQPQKGAFAMEVQLQTALGAFPQTAAPVRLQPEGATRFGGYVRVVNGGAVRLEVLTADGLSQISPDQFPVNEVTQSRWAAGGSQQFAYRFAGATFDLRIRADNILPEIGVSELLVYRLGETELAIDAELELEIREAPLRELILRIPRDYALARLTASELSDYFVTDAAQSDLSQLRLVYGAPVEGRQVVQLRLERNRPLEGSDWGLPRIEIEKAKSVRGYVGVVAEAGYRLTPTLTEGLADVATAFFPRKLEGLQAAFRVRDPGWQAALGVERLPQSIQADALHLFSIGEGIAYGSSVINYVISGAPVSVFEVELSPEYFNVEFTGKDVRNWQRTGNGYQVQLHTPVAGTYTLLATYERPFRAQGETLTFTGARPEDAQSEQGHTLIISSYQFQVRPDNVSTNLLPLEPAEVPAEYRLFFDAPILAAYRYANRPFTLDLALDPLAQGETVGQVIDRAQLTTRISKEGQVLTDARYFVKNKGSPHLRLTIPNSLQLWSVTVNGMTVVPVTTTNGINLIPLPQHADPNAVQELDLKLASRSASHKHLILEAPVLSAPVLLAEWRLEPELGRRLEFRGGSLTPANTDVDDTGFAGLLRLVRGEMGLKLGTSMALAFIAVLVWRWAAREPGRSARYWSGILVGAMAGLVSLIGFVQLISAAGAMDVTPARELSFVAPVQQPGSALALRVSNLPMERSWVSGLWVGWPILLGLGVWVYSALKVEGRMRTPLWIAGWVCLCWGVLRWPNGAPAFFVMVVAFLMVQILIPALRRLLAVPRPTTGVAGASTAIVMMSAGLLAGITDARAGETRASTTKPIVADLVSQEIRVEKNSVLATARIRWNAARNEVLPILREPAVITSLEPSRTGLKLVRMPEPPTPGYALVASEDGLFEVAIRYECSVSEREGTPGFLLPTQFGLINEAKVVLVGLDMQVQSPQAAALEHSAGAQIDTTARLVLAPVNDVWIGWTPRRRDTRSERAVYYAEWAQLYVPTAGVLEGAHYLQIRPAQGELEELGFTVPAGTTITDVMAGMEASQNPGAGTTIAFWRFDPDERRLRVGVSPAQSRPFALLIRSQIAAGPLPYEQSVGLLSLNGAAGEVGMLGIGTGSEVQLDEVNADALAPINLEDFNFAAAFGQLPGVTLRRAYRYKDAEQTCGLRAVAVEADVRVEAQQTLSLGEDRVLLAAQLNVEISRAGVFKLSFQLPAGFDVESISGPALSHWTELADADNRVVTLHLKGKTEGPQSFAASLAGPGLRTFAGWNVPRLVLNEAAKQSGQLLVVPERGMRLQITARDGVTQLDPERAGVREKGLLAFRLLHENWQLTMDVEQVDAWIQVTSLQDITLTDAQIKIAGNLQYQIENTSVKNLRISLPAAAEGVQFRGEDVADYLPAEDQVGSPGTELEFAL